MMRHGPRYDDERYRFRHYLCALAANPNFAAPREISDIEAIAKALAQSEDAYIDSLAVQKADEVQVETAKQLIKGALGTCLASPNGTGPFANGGYASKVVCQRAEYIADPKILSEDSMPLAERAGRLVIWHVAHHTAKPDEVANALRVCQVAAHELGWITEGLSESDAAIAWCMEKGHRAQEEPTA